MWFILWINVFYGVACKAKANEAKGVAEEALGEEEDRGLIGLKLRPQSNEETLILRLFELLFGFIILNIQLHVTFTNHV